MFFYYFQIISLIFSAGSLLLFMITTTFQYTFDRPNSFFGLIQNLRVQSHLVANQTETEKAKKNNKNASKKIENPKNKVSESKKFLEVKKLERDEKQKEFGAKIQKNSQIFSVTQIQRGKLWK